MEICDLNNLGNIEQYDTRPWRLFTELLSYLATLSYEVRVHASHLDIRAS